MNILARMLDSERHFNGSVDPMITADRGFIQFLGPDFGFCLLGSSDRGSQRFSVHKKGQSPPPSTKLGSVCEGMLQNKAGWIPRHGFWCNRYVCRYDSLGTGENDYADYAVF